MLFLCSLELLWRDRQVVGMFHVWKQNYIQNMFSPSSLAVNNAAVNKLMKGANCDLVFSVIPCCHIITAFCGIYYGEEVLIESAVNVFLL